MAQGTGSKALQPAAGLVESRLALAPDYDTNWTRMQQQAAALIASGFLPKVVDTPAKALAIMMTGQELGLAPMASFRLIDVIQGLPTLKPQGMLAIVRARGLLADMKVTDDGQTCTCWMKRADGMEHTERFGMAEASKMLTTQWSNNQRQTIPLKDKDNWRQQPETMRKWRAISACCRVLFPDAIMGLYTTEEAASFTGGEFDMGDYVEGESRRVDTPAATGAVTRAMADANAAVNQAVRAVAPPAQAVQPGSVSQDDGDQPAAPDAVDGEWSELAGGGAPAQAAQPAGPARPPAAADAGSINATEAQLKMIGALTRKLFRTPEEKTKFTAWLKGEYSVDEPAMLTKQQASRVCDALKRREQKLAEDQAS